MTARRQESIVRSSTICEFDLTFLRSSRPLSLLAVPRLHHTPTQVLLNVRIERTLTLTLQFLSYPLNHLALHLHLPPFFLLSACAWDWEVHRDRFEQVSWGTKWLSKHPDEPGSKDWDAVSRVPLSTFHLLSVSDNLYHDVRYDIPFHTVRRAQHCIPPRRMMVYS
jgi:hypothetical protein